MKHGGIEARGWKMLLYLQYFTFTNLASHERLISRRSPRQRVTYVLVRSFVVAWLWLMVPLSCTLMGLRTKRRSTISTSSKRQEEGCKRMKDGGWASIPETMVGHEPSSQGANQGYKWLERHLHHQSPSDLLRS